MAEFLSAGAPVSEVDYSDYVASASTCSVGIVGEAKRGPVGVPTLITRHEDLISRFGEPTLGFYGIYSAIGYLSEGNQLYYTRVVKSGTKASAGVVGTDKVIYSAASDGVDFNNITIEQTVETAGLFDITIKKDTTILETFNVSADALNVKFIETVVNGVSNYIVAHVNETGTISAKTLTLLGGSGSGAYATAGVIGTDKITFKSKYFDSVINGCKVVISEKDDNGYFDITLKNGTKEIETWANVCLEPTDERYAETFINGRSDWIIIDIDTTEGAEAIEFKAGEFTFSGGSDGIEGIVAANIIGQSDNTGIYSFANPENIDISILCASGWTDAEVTAALADVCGLQRKECIFLQDPPFGLKPAQVLAWSNGKAPFENTALNSSYGALYYPWLKVADTYSKQNIWLPPSGYVAAQYAHNDRVGRPWYAPAGLNRGKMVKPIALEYSANPAERDALYGGRNIVNPIVKFTNDGIVIWGQKTMQRKPSATDRVNVRRLINYLIKTVGTATKYFVFEQNDEYTWERWKDMVNPILRNIKDNKGIYDYKIVVAPSVADIENNVMPVSIMIKPTKSAEFIPIKLMIMPTGYSFEDM